MLPSRSTDNTALAIRMGAPDGSTHRPINQRSNLLESYCIEDGNHLNFFIILTTNQPPPKLMKIAYLFYYRQMRRATKLSDGLSQQSRVECELKIYQLGLETQR